MEFDMFYNLALNSHGIPSSSEKQESLVHCVNSVYSSFILLFLFSYIYS